MEYAMPYPNIGRRPRMRDIPQQLLNEADGGERRGHRRSGHRGGRGAGFGPGTPGPIGLGFGRVPGFGPNRGRKRRGDVRLAALLLISETPRNGYQIIQEIASRSEGQWRPSPGAIYPALAQLEDEGLIKTSETETGKLFEITEAGLAEAEAAKDRPAPWESPADQNDPAHQLGHNMFQVGQAVSAVAQSRNNELIEKVAGELDELKRRLYQLLAES